MARFAKLIRGTSIGFALLGQPVIISYGVAQTTQQQCDVLAADLEELHKAGLQRMQELAKASSGITRAERILEALEGTAGRPDLFSGLLSEAAYGPTVMQRFKQEYQLPPALDAPITAGRPADFWRLALKEIRRRMEDRSNQFTQEVVESGMRATLIRMQREKLGCDRGPASAGPLPIRHNPSGLPIITDELLTRWFRAYHAMQSGGAYWRAGDMAQQDFAEVNARVGTFTVAACRPEGKAREDGAREWLCRIDPVRATLEPGFTAEELAVFENRLTEVAAALSGNWSAVRM